MIFRYCLVGAFLSIGMIFSIDAMEEADSGIGFIDTVKIAFDDPCKSLSNNIQLVHLARALAHIPYIATVDSYDSTTIKVSSMLASSSSTFKVLYERLKKIEDYRLIYNFYHEPKLWCYILAAYYDATRFFLANGIALENEKEAKLMRGFKINQSIQLAIEICLRLFALMSNKNNLDTRKNFDLGSSDSSYTASLCAAEVADWVELWRLLSRYTTYMTVSKTGVNFNINFKKNESNDKDETIRFGGSIDSDSGVDFEIESELEHDSISN